MAYHIESSIAANWMGLDCGAAPQAMDLNYAESYTSALSRDCSMDLSPSATASGASSACSGSGSPCQEAASPVRRAAYQPLWLGGLAAPVPCSLAGEESKVVQLLHQTASSDVLEQPTAHCSARRQLFAPPGPATGHDGNCGGLLSGASASRPLSPASLFSAPAGTLTGSSLGAADAAQVPCATARGPSPEVLLATLSAMLSAKQQQAQQARVLGPPGGPRHARPAHNPGLACASCHMVFADVTAYQAHCASQEHAMAVAQYSLLMGVPPISAQVTGQAPAHQPTGPSHLPLPLGPAFNQLPRMLSAAGCAAVPAMVGSSVPTQLALAGSAPALGLSLPMALPPAQPAGFGYAGPSLTTCCNQVIDPRMDSLCHALLKQVRHLDGAERALSPASSQGSLSQLAGALGGDASMQPEADTSSPKPARRLVGGLREVRKAVRHGYAVAVVAAVDIQEINPVATASSIQPGADITDICQTAAARGVPVVFALTRIGLGSIFGTNKRMSAVALTNVAGVEEPTRCMLQLAAQGRAQFAALMRQRQQPHIGA